MKNNHPSSEDNNRENDEMSVAEMLEECLADVEDCEATGAIVILQYKQKGCPTVTDTRCTGISRMNAVAILEIQKAQLVRGLTAAAILG